MTRTLFAALAALLLVGCGGTPKQSITTPTPSPTKAAPAIERYVALGDSFTAAPYVYLTDVANGCLRSDHNYPHLLAKRLKVKQFVDRSCSGALTTDLTQASKRGSFRIPPQLKAVTPATDLVTLSMGGNDGGMYRDTVMPCVERSPRCGQYDAARIATILPGTTTRLEAALRIVRSRAPHATVIVVGYPQLVGTAPARTFPPHPIGSPVFGNWSPISTTP